MSRSPLTPADVERTAELVKVLDSKTRLQILLLLDDGERVVHELVDDLRKSQPLISQHLRVLRKAGLVTSSRQGREVVYSLAKPGVVEIIHDLVELAVLDAAQDELAELRNRRKEEENVQPPASGAAIVDVPSQWRPEQDPGLHPSTARPQRD